MYQVDSLLREKDRDLYLCALLSPKNIRPALMALYAFNAEIALDGKKFSEPFLRQLRLKWWFDSLDRLFKEQDTQHPVMQTLASTVKMGANLSPRNLQAMIEAEGTDHDGQGSEARWTILFRQVLDLVGMRGPDQDAAAGAVAKAWDSIIIIRRKQIEKSDVKKLCGIIHECRGKSQGYWGQAMPALLTMVLANIYLKRVESANYNIEAPIVRRRDPGAMALPRLWWAIKCGKL